MIFLFTMFLLFCCSKFDNYDSSMRSFTILLSKISDSKLKEVSTCYQTRSNPVLNDKHDLGGN